MSRYWIDAYRLWDPQVVKEFDPEAPTHPLLPVPGTVRAEWDSDLGRWVV